MNGSPASRGERFAWCLFDFANSAFNTVVLTFVYGQFFARVLVGDSRRGDVLWANALTLAGVAIAVLSPVLGALADRTAHKRRYLLVCTLVTIGCTALLFWPSVDAQLGRASDTTIVVALVLVAVAAVAFEVLFVFYNAYLPGLADAASLGRLSGYGWAFGYVGGLLCLAVCLAMVGGVGNGPWLPTANDLHVRATNLVAAVWFAVFAIPMFGVVRDRSVGGVPGPTSLWQSVVGVGRTLRELRHYADLRRLLLARLFFNDALVALIELSGLYMSGTLGMTTEAILGVALLLNVVAGLGALVFGFVDDFLGAKTALVASLLLLLAGGALAIAVPSQGMFVVAASLVGLGMGPNQAASRTMLARFTDPARSAEFFGLFALSGKATVWMGPLLFAWMRDSTDQRTALLPLLGMFVLGLLIVLGIDERRGIAAAVTRRG